YGVGTMSKSSKQFHEGYWYRHYHRILEEVPLFTCEAGREWFLEKLDEVFVRRKVSLSLLCLMDTHYHALVRLGPVNLDRALNGIHMSYTRYINKKWDWCGSVFECMSARILF
ncbi:MAG: hypothetical protein ABEJ65_12840, partial [bacterium]